MKKEEWLALFDNTKDKFKWFFMAYGFVEYWNLLLEERKRNNWHLMRKVMDDVWFLLPDDEFNIIENPDGWSDFLRLLEN